MEQSLLVRAEDGVTICAEDAYERDYEEDARDKASNPRISISAPPQVHDFWEDGDEDWVWFERSSSGGRQDYTFVAHPLAPSGTAISMTLFDQAGRIVASGTNLGDVTSDVWLYVLLPPIIDARPLHILDTEDYFLRMTSASGQSGCWTDYGLRMKEGRPVEVWLPVVLRGGVSLHRWGGQHRQGPASASWVRWFRREAAGSAASSLSLTHSCQTDCPPRHWFSPAPAGRGYPFTDPANSPRTK